MFVGGIEENFHAFLMLGSRLGFIDSRGGAQIRSTHLDRIQIVLINRILSTEKKRNRGHVKQDTGDPSQPGGPSKEWPVDFQRRVVLA